MYQIIKNYLSPQLCNTFVEVSKAFIKEYYTPTHLQSHLAYLSDQQPGRESYAFATSSVGFPELPNVALEECDANLYHLHQEMLRNLALPTQSRTLTNFQLYYKDSAAVPMHFDGELLEFKLDGKELIIEEAIRPHRVAVLTLVNDVEGGVGTTLHTPTGVETVYCKAGDLLVFDNLYCHHSVQPFVGIPTRPDGILRMTIGWRSLSEDCYYHKEGKDYFIQPSQVHFRLKKWLTEVWPLKWDEVKNNQHKAAF